jgi:gamma-glutamyl-gamma-aminobutyrate hydrolase PuuD
LRRIPALSVPKSGLVDPVARPIVGITTYVVPARFGAWDVESALVPADYVRAVELAGARPLLVPPSTDGVEETLDAVDGLVLSGGSDLDPELYGHERHDETTDVARDRDDAELALLQAALDRDLPVLAICRGSQMLNVAYGGDLVQHLPDVVGDDRHKRTPGAFAAHDVAIEPGTMLHELMGEQISVCSHHHQGFGRLGEGLRVTAHADDGLPEALEVAGRRFAIGVLWHPEAGDDGKLFEALVEEARRYRAERAVS